MKSYKPYQLATFLFIALAAALLIWGCYDIYSSRLTTGPFKFMGGRTDVQTSPRIWLHRAGKDIRITFLADEQTIKVWTADALTGKFKMLLSCEGHAVDKGQRFQKSSCKLIESGDYAQDTTEDTMRNDVPTRIYKAKIGGQFWTQEQTHLRQFCSTFLAGL